MTIDCYLNYSFCVAYTFGNRDYIVKKRSFQKENAVFPSSSLLLDVFNCSMNTGHEHIHMFTRVRNASGCAKERMEPGGNCLCMSGVASLSHILWVLPNRRRQGSFRHFFFYLTSNLSWSSGTAANNHCSHCADSAYASMFVVVCVPKASWKHFFCWDCCNVWRLSNCKSILVVSLVNFTGGLAK